MSRAARIVGVGMMATIMLAGFVTTAPRRPDRDDAAGALAHRQQRAIEAERLSRCHTITTPDTDCTAAWEAERQRFFGGDGR